MIQSIRLILFSFLFFWSLNLFADADPVVLEKGKDSYKIGLNLDILEDPTGKLTIEDVNKPKWASKFKRSQKQVPNYGQTDKAFWVRFKVKNLSDLKRWYLYFEYSLIDNMNFYRSIPGGWSETKTGDLRKASSKELDAVNFVFKLAPKKEGSLYFLRLQTLGAMQMPMKIYTPEKYYTGNVVRNILDGLYYGAILIMTIYNLFIFLSTFNTSYLYYVAYMLSMILVTMGNTGFGLFLIYPEVPWLSNEGLCMSAFSGMLFLTLFTSKFLKLKENYPISHKVMLAFQIFSFLLIVMSFFASNFILNRFVVLDIMLGMVLTLIVGTRVLFSGSREAKFFFAAFIIYILGVLTKGLTFRGILPANFIFSNGYIFGHVLEAAIFSLGLADVINSLRKEANQNAKFLSKANEDLNEMYVKVEKANEELEDKVKERTKEVVEAKDKAEESEKNISGLLHNMKQSVFSVNHKGLITPPVSEYSYEIFGENLGGQSVFKTVLKDFDEKSEISSKLKFVLGMSIGRDLFQYEVIEDSLPTKLSIFDKDKKEKQLKINYAPILDKDEIIQKIMLVIEDITEIKKLEKEAKDIEAASAIKVKRLQEIVSQDKKDFRVFSRDASLNLDMAEKAVDDIDLDGFFRTVHTIKGVARVYNLTGLSGEVHVLEAEVIVLKEERLDSEDMQGKMNEVYESMRGYVENYLNLAREVYGSDVDETFLAGGSDTLEISKSLFLESLDKIKKMAKEENKTGILDVLNQLEYEKLNQSLLGLQTTVTKISASLNKLIDLNIQGDDVYMDIKRSSMLKDSIMHIIQNSCDHGIEKEGVVNIEIAEKDDNLTITISDNGKGMDSAKIKEKALEKGMINSEEFENLTEEEAISLVMRPGFSTKEIATEYSGRGVGLDVVSTNIKDLGGTVRLKSSLGKGTTFTINISKSEKES